MDNPTSVKTAIKGFGQAKVDRIIMKHPDQSEKPNALKVRNVVFCRGTYMFEMLYKDAWPCLPLFVLHFMSSGSKKPIISLTEFHTKLLLSPLSFFE